MLPRSLWKAGTGCARSETATPASGGRCAHQQAASDGLLPFLSALSARLTICLDAKSYPAAADDGGGDGVGILITSSIVMKLAMMAVTVMMVVMAIDVAVAVMVAVVAIDVVLVVMMVL